MWGAIDKMSIGEKRGLVLVDSLKPSQAKPSQAQARRVLPRSRVYCCIAHRTKCWSMRHAMRDSPER